MRKKDYVGAGLKPAPTKKQMELPDGWQIMSLKQITEINPKIDKSKIADNTIVSFVPMQAVGAGDGRIDISIKKHFADVKKGYTPFQPYDVLFAKITPCMENGKIAVVPALHNNLGLGSTEFHVIRPKNGIDPRYIYYYVSRIDYRKEAASKMTGAVGQKRVPTDFIKSSTIPLAPLDQRKLIVAEIEKQFSRLDEAVAGLKRIKANLKRYKAAVLKAAVEGKLTEEWRKTHLNVETGGELLKRIREAREKWIKDAIIEGQAEAKGLRAKLTKHQFSKPTIELPQKWEWASLLTTCHLVVDCHNKTAPYESQGIPLVRTTNIRDGHLHLNEVKFVSLSTYAYWSRRCPPTAGDILFTREAPMGEAAIIPNGLTLCLGQRTMLLRVFHDLIDVRYLLYAILNRSFQEYLNTVALGTGVKHLRVGDVESLTVPLPPLKEQKAIIEEIERRLSMVDEIEATVDANLKRAERLRQGILRQAFCGQLCVNLREG